MSESFWDPTKVTNLSFSEDPVPNLHHYIENFPGDKLFLLHLGNTANVEFEALTSYSMSLLKPGSIPYQQVITNKKEVPSIPTALKKKVIIQVQFIHLVAHSLNVTMYIRC